MPVHEAAARGFERGAEDYERSRPGYPDEVRDLLAAELPIRSRTQAADVAAGTGKFTRLLVQLGANVVAVEPVAAMRRKLTVVLPDVRILDGTAEALPLDDASVDVVTVAQGFHWFDGPVALAEFRRVLRPNGGLALVWNRRDESVDWVRGMAEVTAWHERPAPHYENLDLSGLFAADGGFTELGRRKVPWEQPMNRVLLAKRVRSTSYISAMEEADREELVSGVLDLVVDQPDEFVLPYVSYVYWCHKR